MAGIVLLQNDRVVGECLRRAIDAQTGLRVAGLACTLAQARDLLARAGTDLLVADLCVGGERLIELLSERQRRVLRGRPQHVLAVAMSQDDPQLLLALRLGAHGYFIHGSPIQALVDVIRQVLAGESPMSASIARRLRAHLLRTRRVPGGMKGQAPKEPALTDADHQLLNRVSQGYLSHEIAREMQTSERGVGLRTRSLYGKLQLEFRGGAVLEPAG
jgi:DNA-binding NarL/FixJ family response regulator